MDAAGTKPGLGYCCSREQPLPREIMRSKTATGRATVTATEPDEHRYIHREAFVEARHPPSRKGEKPSDSCSAKCCGHSQEFCTCPKNASLPTSTRTSPALRLLPADSQPWEKERAPLQEPWPSLSREGPSKMPMNPTKCFLFAHTPLLRAILWS